jgi:hypothetical protein
VAYHQQSKQPKREVLSQHRIYFVLSYFTIFEWYYHHCYVTWHWAVALYMPQGHIRWILVYVSGVHHIREDGTEAEWF